MKKTWIKLKRGLLEIKHRDRIGIRIWVYLFILDQADWVQGAVIEWTDQNAADELGMPISTIRKQRIRLEEDGYISCVLKGDHQIITVKNWTNPREYSGEIYNKEGNQKRTPPKSTHKGNHKSTQKSNHKVITTMDTPSSNSQITNHKSQLNRLGKIAEDGLCMGLQEYFEEKTKLRVDVYGKLTRWVQPITDMLIAVEWDMEQAREYLDQAIEKCDSTNFVFSNPRDILRTYNGIVARQRRGGEKQKSKNQKALNKLDEMLREKGA